MCCPVYSHCFDYLLSHLQKCIDLRHNRGALQGQNNPNRVGPGPQPVQIQVPEGPGGQDHPNERDALL